MGREMAWSKKELDILKKNHGFLDAKKIVEMINENCRQGMAQRSVGSVYEKSMDLGLNIWHKEGYVTLRQAAYLINAEYKELKLYFSPEKRKHREINVYCSAKCSPILISIDDIEPLKKIFPVIPKGFISVKKADSLIGYSGNQFRRVCRDGKIPHIKRNTHYFVDKRLVDVTALYLSKTGRLIIDWLYVVSEYNRLYGNKAA